ncbi:ectonucleoside triphosphate diphosphohydrolase 5-like [Lingula anatina]|uniref:Ectonucleoside triphosphate diphosphohydrolase 5-like n=1 Tax=Lingula anatina TaxID=7574 RepID=A0A1S3JHN0_LINAN|nr:ectonucleoside triphosphate diphosphohydrolase 5-like [Lingula anatina]XP_013409874.1 ectonucleoside triphosphate diphosphohydrolase 5-like [Lingula anatina]XP_023932685.1 ectonucleoside triphosphate diphosphohydrolase 5-like [Lingula anatina]|eukprot:XP_013409873.1 ectonucleoside triphosphate diphosphohydrolase 5-like [Lingula anatina]
MYTVKIRPQNIMREEHRSRMYGFSAVVIVILFILFTTTYFSRPASQKFGLFKFYTPNKDNEFAAIIFDAGSTGSRLHVYHFAKGGSPGSLPKLLSEKFESIKPGLSSYAEDPVKGANSLAPLLDMAKKDVPEEQWSSTPIALMATAGLRLLPLPKSNALLSEVTKLFKSYPFKLGEKGISIMDGTDEGIYSWLTLNFLNGGILGANRSSGALDLGGGSTQITFIPSEKETVEKAPKEYLKNIDVFGKKFDLYTHSYLGLGMMSARFSLLGGTEGPIPKEGRPVEETMLDSVCFPPGKEENWVFGGQKYVVKNSGKKFGFKDCFTLAEALVNSTVQKPVEISRKTFYAFSYYYDRAVEAKLIEETGGTIKVEQFEKAASIACSSRENSERLGGVFQCVDLTFISALLQKGYGFHSDTSLILQKKINDVEITWGLGAAFPLIKKQMDS